MAMELKQSLKMSQQLRMTPQLQQAIKLLQLSRMELANLIATEMVENPVLEEHPENYGELITQPMETEGSRNGEVAEYRVNTELPVPQEGDKPEPRDDIEAAAWESYIDNASSPLPANHYKGLSEDLPSIEATLTRGDDLYDHLTWQLNLSSLSEQERVIGSLIIGNLDENGYLTNSTIEQLAEEADCDVEFAADVLEVIQEFDPIGVGARDLRECLLIQARHYFGDNDILQLVISDHIHNLERKRYDNIARELGLTIDDVIAAAKIISHMEPKPGRVYSTEEPQYITPDIHVYKVGDDYVAVINDEGIPKLKISNYYKDTLAGGGHDEAKKYIQEKVKSAAWLIQSIYRRQRTIVKVTDSIIKFQRDFFDKGINHLKPLVLRDVAEDIGMHESTISRVTTNKYVHTPQGIFELKYFFNSSISKTEGDDIASEAVKTKIKQIIDVEDVRRPLSDAKIVKILHDEHNIEIARRTVAKYREMLGVLSSTQRKRLF